MNTSRPSRPQPAEQADSESFLELVEQLTDRLQAGEVLDSAALAAAYPDYAERLQQFLPALEVLAEIGRSASASRPNPLLAADPLSSPHAMDGTLGDYRIRREIGRGGMGVVYEAEEISLRRRVALKVLPFAAVLDPRQLQRFKNEAMAAAQLKHPHIVSVYAVGFERGVHFYTMEYIEGQSLAELLSHLRPTTSQPCAVSHEEPVVVETLNAAGLSTERSAPGTAHFQAVARLGVQIAEAMEHAHQVGIVHRDIKPANLLVDREGRAWVADFGLAQVETETGLTMTGDVLGTLRYMSPEQAGGQRRLIDHRTDIYSLGVTLFELLTLRATFEETNRRELLRQVLETEPPAPRQLNPAIPRDLETIILKAIAREPPDRYSSAGDLAADLRRFLDRLPIHARRPTLVDRLVKWSRRHTHGLMAAIAVLLVLSAGFAVSTVLILREQARTETARQDVADALVASTQARDRADRQRQAAQQLSVTLALDRGLALCEQGQIAQGLLWLVRALELAPQEAQERQFVVRVNLAAWSQQLVLLQQVHQSADSGTLAAVAFDSQTRLVAAARGHSVHVSDVTTGQKLTEIDSAADVSAVGFGHDERSLLVGDVEGRIQRWDLQTGRVLGPELRQRGTITTIAESPDGSRVLSVTNEGRTQLWNAATGEPIHEMLSSGGLKAAGTFSPDGQTVVTWNAASLYLWDAATGEPARSRIGNAGQQILAATVFPDGQSLLIGRANVAVVRGIVDDKIQGRPLPHRGHVSAVAVDPQGRFLLTGSHDRTARLWDATTHAPIGQPLEHDGRILAVAFRPQRHTFLTADERGTVCVWRLPSPIAPAYILPHPLPPGWVAFDERRSRLVTAYEEAGVPDSFRLWDLASERLLDQFEVVGASCRAMSPSGDALAIAGARGLRLYKLNERFVTEKELDLAAPGAFSLAFSPDGSLLATGLQNAVLRYDSESLTPAGPPLSHPGRVDILAFSADGNQLLTGSRDGSARLWDLATGRLEAQWGQLPPAVRTASFLHDDKALLLGCAGGQVLLVDAETGVLRTEALRMHREFREVSLSPDGRIALAVGGDGVARLYDLRTGRTLGLPRQHYAPITSAVFSPDGRSVATVLPNDSVQVAAVPQPIAGAPERLLLWMEVNTGMELDEEDMPVLLDFATWKQRRDELERH